MLNFLRCFLIGSVGLFLAGCSEVSYERTPVGKLAGKLILEWIDQEKFRFITDPNNPLRFVRANNEVIQPGDMFTDGGSIPRPLRAIKSFSPWGYAPAFIIHDWLFVMNHCKLPGHEKWDHLKAADVFGEVMKTVMENPDFGGPNKLVHYSMVEAVRTDIAKDYWDGGKCETPGGRTRAVAPGAADEAKPRRPLTRGIAPSAPKSSGGRRVVVTF